MPWGGLLSSEDVEVVNSPGLAALQVSPAKPGLGVTMNVVYEHGV
jgi:hypothetical protein